MRFEDWLQRASHRRSAARLGSALARAAIMEPRRISVIELKRRLDAHEPVVVIDARALDAWNRSDVQLPGAIRVPPDEVDRHLSEIPRGTLVVPYCT